MGTETMQSMDSGEDPIQLKDDDEEEEAHQSKNDDTKEENDKIS